MRLSSFSSYYELSVLPRLEFGQLEPRLLDSGLSSVATVVSESENGAIAWRSAAVIDPKDRVMVAGTTGTEHNSESESSSFSEKAFSTSTVLSSIRSMVIPSKAMV